jgi:uncharacterized protein involved in high-affinity Fe2+ transport
MSAEPTCPATVDIDNGFGNWIAIDCDLPPGDHELHHFDDHCGSGFWWKP